MTTIDKDSINQRTNNRHLLRRFCARGPVPVQSNPAYIMLIAILLTDSSASLDL